MGKVKYRKSKIQENKAEEEIQMKKRKVMLLTGGVAAAVVLILCIAAGVYVKRNFYTPQDFPVYGFANMRGDGGRVYRGIGGAYGDELPMEASTFAVREDRLYYAGQIKEDYVISEERTGTICESSLDGSGERVLVEDAYNLGFGQEKLIGDKIFYPTGLDEDFHTVYAWYDLNTGEKEEIKSIRINNIFGYDGTCIFYSGFDAKKSCNIVGKYHLGTKRDRILFSYGESGEIGDIISLYYEKGNIYAVTLMEEAVNYDARTAVYQMLVHSAQNGKVTCELPLAFTGSANYGFLYDGGAVFYSTAEAVYYVELGASLEVTELARLSEREYWGIPHFAPGDGYLYYETIADIDEETGMNDYFYRIPLSGGEPELLASWFTS